MSETELPCQGKMVFDSQKEALMAASALKFQRGEQLKAYKCKHCNLWHLSSR